MLVVSKIAHTTLPHYKSILYTTAAPSDYGSLDMVLMFGECERRKCVNVTIVDDFEDELDENFFYHLEETPNGLHPNIELNPVDGEIVIEDNDGR